MPATESAPQVTIRNQSLTQINQNFHRWGGAAFMIGSFLFLLNKVNEMSLRFLSRPMGDLISGQDAWLIAVGQAIYIIGFIAFFLEYRTRAARFGKITLGLACGGGILMALGHVTFMQRFELDSLFMVVFFGAAALIIGLILFGIANLRLPVTGRWKWLPLATGIMGFIGFFLFSGEEITATFLLFRTLFALGLFGLGLVLFLEKEEVQW